jgi:hypothetical protein
LNGAAIDKVVRTGATASGNREGYVGSAVVLYDEAVETNQLNGAAIQQRQI